MLDAGLVEDASPTEDAQGCLALWPAKQGNHTAMPQQMCNRCVEESESWYLVLISLETIMGKAVSLCCYFKAM